MMDEKTKQWFIEKVAQEPEYLSTHFMPAVETSIKKAELELHQAIRKGTTEQIKYAMGWFDGVSEVLKLLGGLRLSQRPKDAEPAGPGLMDRIRGVFG